MLSGANPIGRLHPADRASSRSSPGARRPHDLSGPALIFAVVLALSAEQSCLFFAPSTPPSGYFLDLKPCAAGNREL